MKNLEGLYARAKALRLHGLLAHWSEAIAEARANPADRIEQLIDWEEQERARRSLERRLQDAHISRFKSLCDFDWKWPKRWPIGGATFEALMSLEFLKERRATPYWSRPKWRRQDHVGAQSRPPGASFTATPSCSPALANCSATSPLWIAIPPCAEDYGTTPHPHSC